MLDVCAEGRGLDPQTGQKVISILAREYVVELGIIHTFTALWYKPAFKATR